MKSSSAGGARPRLSRSSSVGRPPGSPARQRRRAGSAGQPRRPRLRRRGRAAAEQPGQTAGRPAPGRAAPPTGRASAPVRSAACRPRPCRTASHPRSVPASRRVGAVRPAPVRRPAVAGPATAGPVAFLPAVASAARGSEPQAVQHNKNNAPPDANRKPIKQEKAPQAFRVWLRKKRQQQLMEQRVATAAAARGWLATAAAPPCRQQRTITPFRQWLARKQRERTAAGGGPTRQATLHARWRRCWFRAGRPAGRRRRRPPRPPTAHLRTTVSVVRAAGQPTCPAADASTASPCGGVAAQAWGRRAAAAVLASSSAQSPRRRGRLLGADSLPRACSPACSAVSAQHGTMSATWAGAGAGRL